MYPLSGFGFDSDALNFNYDINGEILRHPDLGSTDAREVARYGEFKSSDSLSDVGDDIGSNIEQVITDGDNNLEEKDILPFSRCSDSTPMDTVNHKAHDMPQSDNGLHPYTLVNEVTGISDGKTDSEDIPLLVL